MGERSTRIASALFVATFAAQSLFSADMAMPAPQDPIGSKVSILTISAFAFTPWDSEDAYATTANGARWSVSGTGLFSAPLFLPSGALVRVLELLGCDTNDQGGMSATIFGSSFGATSEQSKDLVTVYTGNFAGCYSFGVAPSKPITVDNRSGAYWVSVAMMPPGAPSLRFIGVRIHYQLQISPAPGFPTFADVPANHPYFRAVEALAASGITGGCGNGNFCPDLPVTRGALAKFLANGLGLSWGLTEYFAASSP